LPFSAGGASVTLRSTLMGRLIFKTSPSKSSAVTPVLGLRNLADSPIFSSSNLNLFLGFPFSENQYSPL